MTRVALIHGIVRQEERLLMDALAEQPGLVLSCHHESEVQGLATENTDIALIRCVSQIHAATIACQLEGRDLPCINASRVIDTCGDKVRTAIALQQHQVAQPPFAVAYSADEALAAIADLGYPVVLKPPIGSWGRLLARINDRDAAEAVLEHKARLGGPHHHVYFIQQYMEKEGRDVRAFVAGNRVLAAIERHSDHWITNTARGASVTGLPLCDDLVDTALAAAYAVGGGILAVDLFATPDGFLVNEVNDRMEFRNSSGPTGIDLAREVAAFISETHMGVLL